MKCTTELCANMGCPAALAVAPLRPACRPFRPAAWPAKTCKIHAKWPGFVDNVKNLWYSICRQGELGRQMAFERLEPGAGKLARPILRGYGGVNVALLADHTSYDTAITHS